VAGVREVQDCPNRDLVPAHEAALYVRRCQPRVRLDCVEGIVNRQ
jgi:hypothetical protein